jgi:hypothetical protein
MKKVFISGPYTSDPEINTELAIDAGTEIIKLGHCPFIPHLSHFVELRNHIPYETWLKIDLVWMKLCDCVYRLPGRSKGADLECREASGIMPIFFDFNKLKLWLKL